MIDCNTDLHGSQRNPSSSCPEDFRSTQCILPKQRQALAVTLASHPEILKHWFLKQTDLLKICPSRFLRIHANENACTERIQCDNDHGRICLGHRSSTVSSAIRSRWGNAPDNGTRHLQTTQFLNHPVFGNTWPSNHHMPGWPSE